MRNVKRTVKNNRRRAWLRKQRALKNERRHKWFRLCEQDTQD